MKSLVIYDSTYGNTKKIAEIIAKELKCAAVKSPQVSNEEISDAELIVVGSPIIGWKPSENMGKFLSGLTNDQLKGKKVATFDTRVKLFIHGDAAKKIAKALELCGANTISEPEYFYVKGTQGPLFDKEEEKALTWAKKLLAQ